MNLPDISDHRRLDDRSLQTFPPESHNDLVRRRGGLISVPRCIRSFAEANAASQRLTKLLLNVTLKGTLGPVQVVMSPESSVGDLIRVAVETYGKEKRCPHLKETDPRRFELHYSSFSLESLKAEDKLMNLGSRNFFLCSKPTSRDVSSHSEAANTQSAIDFMEFLL